jgi:hypothetical protein
MRSMEVYVEHLGYANDMELIQATKSVRTFTGHDGQPWVAPIPDANTVKELALIDETSPRERNRYC